MPKQPGPLAIASSPFFPNVRFGIIDLHFIGDILIPSVDHCVLSKYAANNKTTDIQFIANDCLILSQRLTRQMNMHYNGTIKMREQGESYG